MGVSQAGLHPQLILGEERQQRMVEETEAVAVEEAPAAEEAAAVEASPAKDAAKDAVKAPAKVAGKVAGKAIVKAKKEKKLAKAKTAPSHPTHGVMITAAVGALKDRTGSSRQAILKYICANYKVDDKKAATQTRLALKRMTAGGELKMAKDKGKGAGCYKLASSEKADKPVPAKKAKKPAKKEKKPATAAAKKAKATKVTKPKSAAKLKPAAKKSAAKKAGAKKPGKKTVKKGKK